jgi:hypothetical protein
MYKVFKWNRNRNLPFHPSKDHGYYMVDALNDVRIISVITLVALTAFTFFGMEIASKLQLVFFVILIAAIANMQVFRL